MEAAKVICTALALVLVGCATATQRDFCAIASPITTGKKETLSKETLKQIAAHNGRGEQLCGWSNK